MKSNDFSEDLLTFVNIYLLDMIKLNPDLTFETQDRDEFWERIDADSARMQNLESFWPKEDKNIDIDQQYDEDISSGLVFNMNNPHWRLKSPDEIDQTFEDYENVKFDIENDMEINFQRAEDVFDPDELSIYRVSVTPLTEGSIIKQIEGIKRKYEDDVEEEDDLLVKDFENQNEIVFIRTNLDIFDNQQVNSNQIFIVSSPYTIYLWIGQKVENWMIKGSISIFRKFSYEVRSIPLTFYPSYTDEEQNLGTPNLQIIFKNSEPSRFQKLFKNWTEVKFPYLMLRANSHYTPRGASSANNPRWMTMTGRLSKLEEIREEK